MKRFEAAIEIEPVFRLACAAFVNRIVRLIEIQSLAVVSFDQEQDTSRVVFTWEAPKQSDSHAPLPIPVEAPPGQVVLKGDRRPVGAVLLHGQTDDAVGPGELALIREPIEHLAAVLEIAQLHHGLARNALEMLALDRIGELAGSGAPSGRVFRAFAAEIKKLIAYRRVTVFLVDREADQLTCLYRSGVGARRQALALAGRISGTGYDVVVSTGQAKIIGDLPENADTTWPELGGRSTRSALVAPVTHTGDVIGVVALEERLPNAFSIAESRFLTRAAALLGPYMASSKLFDQQPQPVVAEVASNEIAEVLTFAHNPDELLERFVKSAFKPVQFDCATLAWIDPNGYDIHALRAFPQSGFADLDLTNPELASINTKLKYGQKRIGTLSLWQKAGGSFTPDDLAALDGIGGHFSAAIQYNHLYLQTQRHGFQLGELDLAGRSLPSKEMPAAEVGGETDPLDTKNPIHSEPTALGYSLSHQKLLDAAHALRTPLSSIKGYSSTLLQTDIAWPPELHQEFLQTIDREADQLDRAINDLLSPAGMGPDDSQLHPPVADIPALFRSVSAELAAHGLSNRVRFEHRTDLPLVQVGLSRLVKVVFYLIACAVNAVPTGATLRVHASPLGEWVRVAIGVAAEEEPNADASQDLDSEDIASVDPLLEGVDEDLMLSVCETALQAYGTELIVGAPGQRQKVYRFDLPVYRAGLL